MRVLAGLFVVGLMLSVAGTAGALTWDLSNVDDYRWFGSAAHNPFGGYGSVASLPNDDASILAKINTQAAGLKLGDILGGGYTINSFYTDSPGTTSAVYGSLYLSPTGGPGANVLILLSPLTVSGSGGAYEYTFDLSTHADYRTWDTGVGNWTAYDSARSGTFGNVVGMINATAYSSDFAAFFGPQIGDSDTHNTQFNVTEIEVSTVPEPLTMAGLMLGIGGLVGYVRKRRMA
jgi:hypothetical protein